MTLTAEDFDRHIAGRREERRGRYVQRKVRKAGAMRQMSIDKLTGQLTRQLQLLGFVPVHRSRNGSRYLIYPPYSFRLRVSDHPLPPLHGDRYGNLLIDHVMVPLTIEEAKTLAFELALAYVLRAGLRSVPR